MLDAHNFSTIVNPRGPRVAFDTLLNLIEIDPTYWDATPKKYTISSDPLKPISLQDAYALISQGDFSLKNNYAGCFFIENKTYLFFMLKKVWNTTNNTDFVQKIIDLATDYDRSRGPFYQL